MICINEQKMKITANTYTSSFCLLAQDIQKPDNSLQTKKTQPSETSTDLYKVAGVILIVWIGLAFFLFRLDRKIARLEKDIKKTQ
jgi:CcmD family protein